jgi:hypothetical protein
MDEKPKGKPRLSAQQSPCPVCGGDSYTWGKPVDDHPNQRQPVLQAAGWRLGRRTKVDRSLLQHLSEHPVFYRVR